MQINRVHRWKSDALLMHRVKVMQKCIMYHFNEYVVFFYFVS